MGGRNSAGLALYNINSLMLIAEKRYAEAQKALRARLLHWYPYSPPPSNSPGGGGRGWPRPGHKAELTAEREELTAQAETA